MFFSGLKATFWALALITVLVAGLTVAAGAVFLQNDALLPAAPPPDGDDVASTRKLVQRIRAAAGDEDGSYMTTNAEELNRAMQLAERLVPGFRGQLDVEEQGIFGRISVPVPWITGQKWLNVTGRIPEFEGTMWPSLVTVGGRSVPPSLALGMFRTVANMAGEDRLGDKILGAATSMEIVDDGLRFQIALDDMGNNGLMRGTFAALRGSQMPTPEVIDTYYRDIRQAMDEGALPLTGSFLPYITFALDAAYRSEDASPLPERYTAAILALAKACGAADISLVVGRLVFKPDEQKQLWATRCHDVTLNDRIDSRRHFITSSALQAISNSGFAVSVGEFKELYDTISGSGGFDFTDMAANLSGIRLSNTIMALPDAKWPDQLAKISEERDLIVAFSGIPGLMPKEDFEARFGDVESPAYKRMLRKIEKKIDALPIHSVAE